MVCPKWAKCPEGSDCGARARRRLGMGASAVSSASDTRNDEGMAVLPRPGIAARAAARRGGEAR